MRPYAESTPYRYEWARNRPRSTRSCFLQRGRGKSPTPICANGRRRRPARQNGAGPKSLGRPHPPAHGRPNSVGGEFESFTSRRAVHLSETNRASSELYFVSTPQQSLCSWEKKAAASPENARGENLRTAWGFWDRSATRPPESGNFQALGVRRSLPFRLAAPPSSLRGPIFAHAERPPPPTTKPTPPTPQSRTSINYKDGVSPRSSRHPARQFSGEQMR